MNADSGTLPWYFALLFPVFFACVWVFACIVVGIISGWHSLAKRFSSNSAPYGETKTVGPFFYSIYTRFWGHYSSVIRLTAADDALYLSVLSLFRAGHPPLRIPWMEITFGTSKLLWKRYIVLTLGNEEQIPMRISERMARNLGILQRFMIESRPTG
jgi:hypothetical protein